MQGSTIFLIDNIYTYYGDFMKKYFSVIAIAIILGFLFAFYIFHGVNKTFAQIKDVNGTIFQVGVFKIYENAVNKADLYPSSIIMKKDDYYFVYIGLCISGEVCKKYENYYESENISFYKKKIIIKDKCLNKINMYEELVSNTNKTNIYPRVSKEILNYYVGGCNDKRSTANWQT